MEIFSGKKDVDQIQRNLNWVDNQIKNLEQTKFILDQQINKMKAEREKLTEKLKKWLVHCWPLFQFISHCLSCWWFGWNIKNLKTEKIMNEMLEFNDWVDALIEDLANNEDVSLLEFHVRFNQIEFERQQLMKMISNLNNLLDDNDFS